ncbi:MAG TPA: VOC family protein [Roseiarcus sp.]|nr:VOC family protein [Roseiarcus sp.]
MFDHLGFAVADFDKSRTFYLKALAPLGVKAMMEGDGHLGLGSDRRPQFWIGKGEAPPGRLHLAFAAKNRGEVRAFYEAALAAGGKDNGPPGLRPNYHPNYYGAFVIDPNGHNIEAVCHVPEA